MSILNLQSLEPIAADSAVAVWSITSSSSDCCKSDSQKPTA